MQFRLGYSAGGIGVKLRVIMKSSIDIVEALFIDSA